MNVLSESSSLVFPPLWALIYHEAIRNNHLLFSHDDLTRFSSEAGSLHSQRQADKEQLCKTVCELFSCSDLSSMQSLITRLPYRLRADVFAIYLRFIDDWRQHARVGLN